MKSQRSWKISLSTIFVFVAGASAAFGQFPMPHHQPGFHPAALPYSVMMGQEQFDPTWIGAENYGDTCCGPNWYDVSVEAVYMKREDAGRAVPISSDGIAGAGAPNVVLSTADLDFQFEPGLRFFARHQMSAVYSVEAGYMGAVDWSTYATAFGNHTLYSSFSQFGNVPFGGFADVDQAYMHSLQARTDIDSIEINLRRGWSKWNNKVHGGWIAGLRWFQLRDKLRFYADVRQHTDPIGGGTRGPAQTDYQIITDNDLYGGQIGGQLGFCLIPGLVVNGEIKAGGYGNRATLDSSLTSTSLGGPLLEGGKSDDFSLLAEAGAYVTYQCHPLVKIRAGYQAMYLEGVALSGENFNSVPPFGGATRTVSINDNGNSFFHGGLLGLEVGW